MIYLCFRYRYHAHCLCMLQKMYNSAPWGQTVRSVRIRCNTKTHQNPNISHIKTTLLNSENSENVQDNYSMILIFK